MANVQRNDDEDFLFSNETMAKQIRHHELIEFRKYFNDIILKQLCNDYHYDDDDNHRQNNDEQTTIMGMRIDDNNPKFPNTSIINDWCRHMLLYNVTNGKLNRGLLLVISYRLLLSLSLQSNIDYNNNNNSNNSMNDNEFESKMNNARLLGWCMEMFQSSFLILDDIMDESFTRRNQPCWYRLPTVGMKACNDSILLESFIFQLLRKHLHNHPNYVEIVDLIHYAQYVTAVGQCMDTNMAKNYDKFDMKLYSNIIKHKTSFYTFVMPVRLALYLANINDSTIHNEMETILFRIGELFQIQDDFLDCFENIGDDQNKSGKIGTDIRDGKCTWLIVMAKQLANDQQLKTLKCKYNNVTSDEDESIIKEIYMNLNLKHEFHKYYCDQMTKIIDNIEQFKQCQDSNSTKIDRLSLAKLFNEPLTHIFIDRNQ